MQRKNKMQIQFLSHSINEAFARVSISAFISQLDPTLEELYDIKMAVSEAVTNAIVHGYSEKKGTVTIECSYEGDTLEIEVKDEGKGINNVEQAMMPLYTASESEDRAGLGFTVMQEMMDDIEVCSHLGKGTSVKMKKSLKR